MNEYDTTKNDEIMEKATFSYLFQINIDRFLEEISALNDTLPIESILLSMKHKQLIERLSKISVAVEVVDEYGKEFTRYKANLENLDEFENIHKHLKRTDIAIKILPRNFIVSIVSQYDAFLGDLLRSIYKINPNIIRTSEKELVVEHLFQYASIDELKAHIVDKEVESLLREEHYEQLKVLERRITKITGNEFTLTSDLPVLPSFIELTQRRNLYVHANGLTTRQYFESKKKWKFECESCEELNVELTATPEYCEKAFQILYEMSVKLTHVLWRKFVPEERRSADEHLNGIIYELLKDKEYDLAITIGNFATDIIKRFSSEQIRKFIIINKAIAYKLQDKENECKKVIKSEDWTIGNEFKLAKLVLEDNFEDAKKLMIRIGDTDDILNKKAYETWPLFTKYRKSEEFKSAYFELFKEEFTIEEIQGKLSNENDEKEE